MSALVIVNGKSKKTDAVAKRYGGFRVIRGEKQSSTFVFKQFTNAVETVLKLSNRDYHCKLVPLADLPSLRAKPSVRKTIARGPGRATAKMESGRIGAVAQGSFSPYFGGLHAETMTEPDLFLVRPILPPHFWLPSDWIRRVNEWKRGINGEPDTEQSREIERFSLASEFLGYTLTGYVDGRRLPRGIASIGKRVAKTIGLPVCTIRGVAFGHASDAASGLEIVIYSDNEKKREGILRLDPLGTFRWSTESLSSLKFEELPAHPQFSAGKPSFPDVAVEIGSDRYGTVGGYVGRSGSNYFYGLTCAHVIGDAKSVSFSPNMYPVHLAIRPSACPGNAVDVALIGPIDRAAHSCPPSVVGSWADSVELDTKIEAFGAKSGHSRSVVVRIFSSPVDLRALYTSEVPIWFHDICACQPFTLGGDSGAVATRPDNSAIGLVIAGSSSYSLVQAFGRIAEALQVERSEN